MCDRKACTGPVSGGTVGVIIMKLGMYIICRKSSDSSVQAFALDHINDVLVNSVGLAGETHTLPRPQLHSQHM